ncbi:MAG: GDP-6-deoxy-D-lyxo-4-hexulose reductase [Acidiphilium sp. 37-64-53]|uniref:GDP-mannose 4,6-dehydratase n=1 Tax=Acidiphilium TaxID=522 RepID=UPI000BC640A4|nr:MULTISPECIES: GDP-mannose 4,6-dehydratase [Acidiphilium]OYW04150.1 MAG: GDP-6-deoxy-D-lyxo-4-hexulose reductase [Acidiphilium sp. 37-64-53]OZB31085.1 MAG: GDP-6-deoxy-D-lyxo-4-hexulose reductase [Acidiphilium sp. 34-64-41]HQT83395.1 GDP-mannose 4,6-dehydratase [Acidiphilium rubrum]
MTPDRILITGSTGFVGGYLRTALAAKWPAAALIPGDADVTDAAAVRRMIEQARPDAVVHLAGIASVPAARLAPDRAFAVNLGGSIAVARAIIETAPNCLMVHVGSAECYGGSFRAGTALDESAALAPLNTYAATKAAADLALGAMAAESGLRLVRFRPFNHTGPGQSDAFVIAAFAAQIAAIMAGRQPPVIKVGNLDAARDFLDVRDIVRAYTLAIAHANDLMPGAIFNLASGTPRRIGDILHTMISAADRPITVEIDPARLRPVDIPSAFGDATAADRILGWRPTIDLTTTLQDMLTANTRPERTQIP